MATSTQSTIAAFTPASVVSAQFLDDAAAALRDMRGVNGAMATIFARLRTIRESMTPASWKTFTSEVCHHHPLIALLEEDPLTHRVRSRPRGYAGDAVMLDYMYALEDSLTPPEVEASSALGKLVYAFTVRAEAAEAVRGRRQLLARRIDEVAARQTNSSVLSVACGHLREAALCEAVREGRLGRFVALDQDAESLAVVERELGSFGVEPLQASVRNVLTDHVNLADFDFIYAAGLYDYLPGPVAQKLTTKLFDRLRPGGTLLIGNILEGIDNAAYMEAILDWWLIYRSRSDLLALSETVPAQEVGSIRLFTDAILNVGYIEIERKA